MVMSVGWNPHFENEKKSVEVHVLRTFANDFYGEGMRVLIVGYIRPMSKFSSLEALIEAIHRDIAIARDELAQHEALSLKTDPFFSVPVAGS